MTNLKEENTAPGAQSMGRTKKVIHWSYRREKQSYDPLTFYAFI